MEVQRMQDAKKRRKRNWSGGSPRCTMIKPLEGLGDALLELRRAELGTQVTTAAGRG